MPSKESRKRAKDAELAQVIRVVADDEERGYRFVNSLDPEQHARAIIHLSNGRSVEFQSMPQMARPAVGGGLVAP